MIKSLALSGAVALLAACATAPVSPGKTTAATTKPPPGCVAQTATRIPVKDDQCAAFGNTYTREDINRTGQTDVGAALSMMDPAVSHH